MARVCGWLTLSHVNTGRRSLFQLTRREDVVTLEQDRFEVASVVAGKIEFGSDGVAGAVLGLDSAADLAAAVHGNRRS